MADLRMFSVENALNVDISGDWKVSERLNISDQSHACKKISEGTMHIVIWSDSDIYMRWDNAEVDTIDINNDIIIPGETLVIWRVPNALKGSGKNKDIYVHFKQVISAPDKYLRLVEV